MLRENLSGVYKEVEIFQFLGERCDRLVEKVMKRLEIYKEFLISFPGLVNSMRYSINFINRKEMFAGGEAE